MKRKPTGKAANPMRARDGKLLQTLAVYQNFHADAVTEADVRALADEFSLTTAQAFALLLAGALGLDAAENEEDARTVREDFPRMLHPLDAAAYANDPYARALRAAASREQSLPDKPTDPAAHFHASRAALSREDISHTLHPRCAAADAGAPRESNAGGRRSASCTLLPQNAAADAGAPRESNAGGHEDALRTRRSRNTLGRENASQAGAFELGYASYRPYELFVADDLRAYPDGAVLPVLGYFTRPFAYPVLTENGREWMTATPNEINTIRPMAEAAHGHVLTLGLGLGYFAFHALLNPRVERVTAVERSADAIRLFRERILPAFPRPECLTILQADAFAAAPALYQSGQYDFVFADLWHDAADGLPMYERLKQMEVPGPEYRYWIEKTLEFYR